MLTGGRCLNIPGALGDPRNKTQNTTCLTRTHSTKRPPEGKAPDLHTLFAIFLQLNPSVYWTNELCRQNPILFKVRLSNSYEKVAKAASKETLNKSLFSKQLFAKDHLR